MKIPFFFLPLLSLLFCSCGTISHMEPTGASQNKKFSKVIVRDFSANQFGYEVKSKVEMAKKSFPDKIAGELQKKARFSKISRSGTADSDTLVIDGIITDYDDGNAFARFMVGMGAGTARFNATVNFRDGYNRIGSIDVDKNSWILGGSLAATQTAETFIPGAAKKVAVEANKLAR